MRDGWRSPKWGHLGVYFLCTGPAPGPMPGERLQVVIYDEDNKVVRRLEQVEGETIDPGYVDFFMSSRTRPSIVMYHIKDFDPEGNETTLFSSTSGHASHRWLQDNFSQWAQEHGVPA